MISCHQYVDTDKVSSLSDKYNRKRHFIRARPEGIFYENLVCIVLIIGSELDIMKRSLTTRESTYIELVFHTKNQCPRLKAFAKTDSSEMPKIFKKRSKSGL